MAVFFTRRGKAQEIEQYIWQKYAVTTTYTTKETSVNETKAYTGNIYNSSALSVSSDGSAFTFGSYSAALTYASVPSMYQGNPYFGEAQNSSVAYHCSSAYASGSTGYLTADKKYERVQTKTQGSYIENVVSTDPAAYPDNGIQDGYWYVKVA